MRRLALVAGLIGVLLVAGCTNPFEPAKPPTGTGGGVVEDFTTPTKLFNTLAAAIAAKADGAAAYADAFADSNTVTDHAFYAYHYPGVIDAYRASVGRDPQYPWTKTLERQFYSYLTGNVLPTFAFTMQWTEDPNSPNPQIDEVAGTALYHINYVVVAAPTSGSGEQHTILIGFADISLYKANSRWFIYRWQDRIDPGTGVNPSDPFELSWGARRLESL